MRLEAATPVSVDVTFLRMDRKPPQPSSGLPGDTAMQQVARCSTSFYRYLYNTVGHHYVWWLRRTLADDQLAELLAHPEVSIHVLYRDGEPAGFYELDRRNRPYVNLSYFGLLPHAVGQGLGAAFLRDAVDRAWAEDPRGITVNTCTADHPRALPNYLAAGFTRLRTVGELWNVPVRLGLPIPDRLRA